MQFLPNPASTACINRRFEECSEQELETEMKMFLHELKNALWHNSNTAAVPGSPFEAPLSNSSPAYRPNAKMDN